MSSSKPNRDSPHEPAGQYGKPPDRPINTELVEHRIDETAEAVKEISSEIRVVKEAVIRIEAKLENMASSTELETVKIGIERVKVWVLTGALAGVGVGIGAAFAIAKMVGSTG